MGTIEKYKITLPPKEQHDTLRETLRKPKNANNQKKDTKQSAAALGRCGVELDLRRFGELLTINSAKQESRVTHDMNRTSFFKDRRKQQQRTLLLKETDIMQVATLLGPSYATANAKE